MLYVVLDKVKPLANRVQIVHDERILVQQSSRLRQRLVITVPPFPIQIVSSFEWQIETVLGACRLAILFFFLALLYGFAESALGCKSPFALPFSDKGRSSTVPTASSMGAAGLSMLIIAFVISDHSPSFSSSFP